MLHNEMPEILESIVVEGRGDYAAVLSAVSADIIITHGFKIRNNARARILRAAGSRGVIIFTDPDHAGESIRRQVTAIVGNSGKLKHARLVREDALCGADIGVENARPESILDALKKSGATFRFFGGTSGSLETEAAGFVSTCEGAPITEADMHRLGLVGSGSKKARTMLGRELGIGYANSKQFLHRLNATGVTNDQLEKLLAEE